MAHGEYGFTKAIEVFADARLCVEAHRLGKQLDSASVVT